MINHFDYFARYVTFLWILPYIYSALQLKYLEILFLMVFQLNRLFDSLNNVQNLLKIELFYNFLFHQNLQIINSLDYLIMLQYYLHYYYFGHLIFYCHSNDNYLNFRHLIFYILLYFFSGPIKLPIKIWNIIV